MAEGRAGEALEREGKRSSGRRHRSAPPRVKITGNIPENIPEPPDGFEGFWDDLPENLKLEYQGLVTMERLPKSEYPLCFRLMLGRKLVERRNAGVTHFVAAVCG